MVYRFVKKASRFTSIVILLVILCLVYYLSVKSSKAAPSSRKLSPPILRSQVKDIPDTLGNSQHQESLHHKLHLKKSGSQGQGSIIKLLLSNTSNFSNLNSTRGKKLLSRIKTDCRHRTCSEFLTKEDRRHFKYCVHKTWKTSLGKYLEPPQSQCVFVNGSGSFPMGLASYPGSGNTWIRGLIQKVTGLCIGGIYCDTTLRKNGYPGESVRSATTFMVKTHQVDPRWQGVKYPPNAPFTYFTKLEDVPVFSGGVFILRNPFHAMVAEYKRQVWEDEPDNHVRSLGKTFFGNNPNWNNFVYMESETWQQTVLGWLTGSKKNPVLAVKYETFQRATKKELEHILNFLEVPYSRDQLDKVVQQGYNAYHRPKGEEFEHYTELQKNHVRELVRSTSESISQLGYEAIFEYLEP